MKAMKTIGARLIYLWNNIDILLTEARNSISGISKDNSSLNKNFNWRNVQSDISISLVNINLLKYNAIDKNKKLLELVLLSEGMIDVKVK